MGVCVKCGRSLVDDNDYGGWCGMCDCCPRCGRVVDRINIYQDGDNSCCIWCKDDYLAEKEQLEAIYDSLQDDSDVDNTNDIHEESRGNLLGQSQVLALSGETNVKVLKKEKRTIKKFIKDFLSDFRSK